MPTSEPATTATTTTGIDVLGDLAVASDLPREEIATDEDLLGLGIDSVRLMHLVEAWRAAGADVDFADVAACVSVGDALDLLASRS